MSGLMEPLPSETSKANETTKEKFKCCLEIIFGAQANEETFFFQENLLKRGRNIKSMWYLSHPLPTLRIPNHLSLVDGPFPVVWPRRRLLPATD